MRYRTQLKISPSQMLFSLRLAWQTLGNWVDVASTSQPEQIMLLPKLLELLMKYLANHMPGLSTAVCL